MDTVSIINQSQDDSGWTFVLDIAEAGFVDEGATINVRLDEDTMLDLVGDADVYPDDLILLMFEAIAAKEYKDSLPPAIDVDELLVRMPWLKQKVDGAIETGSLLT